MGLNANLWVHEKNDVGLETEFLNVTKCANANKLMVNMAKTKELVFHRTNAGYYLPPPELPCIEGVICVKPLGVWQQDDLGTRRHTEYIMHICSQRAYLLTQLKRQGLPLVQLQKVFDSIILARLLYAAPALRGYLSSTDINCLQQFVDKAKR